jgi:cyclase
MTEKATRRRMAGGAILIALLIGGQDAVSAAQPPEEIYDLLRAGDLAGVRAMVAKDPNILRTRLWGGMTVLFPAIEFRKPEIVKYLVSAGADVNAVAKYRGTPLDVALDAGDPAVIDLLRSKGARPTPLEFETFRLAENVHRVAFPWGMRNNVVVFSGPDGILVVDSGFSRHAVDALKRTIGGLAPGEIRYVISTHPHGDHVEGNGIVASEANVIDFEKLDGPALAGLVRKSDTPLRGPAGRELRGSYVLSFNGEDVRIIPNPGLHSQSDILIHFPKEKVLCMGDLLLSQNCPALQDVPGYMALLDTVLDVFPPETVFVSGHGKDLTAEGLGKYRDDLAGMIGLVREHYASGESAEDMVRKDELKAYKAEYSFLDWLGPDSWITSVCRALRSGALR